MDVEEVAKALQQKLEIKNKETEILSKSYLETKQAFEKYRKSKRTKRKFSKILKMNENEENIC